MDPGHLLPSLLWSRAEQLRGWNRFGACLNDGWTVGAACERDEQIQHPRVAMVAHVKVFIRAIGSLVKSRLPAPSIPHHAAAPDQAARAGSEEFQPAGNHSSI